MTRVILKTMTNNPSQSDSQAFYPPHSTTRSIYPPPKPPSRYVRRPRQKVPSYAIVLGTVFLGSLILMIVITAGALGLYGYYQISERIVPGVQVLDMRLEGMTPTQAAIDLHKYWNLERQIIVSDGINTLAVHPSILGISIDSIQTAQAAYQVGHSWEILSDLDQILSSHQNGWQILPIVTFDEGAARAGLESLASQISQAPKDATIRLQGPDLVAIPAELGYTINIEETLSDLGANPYSIMINGSAQIYLKPIPARIDDVSGAIEEAREL
ncbi:peptidoglycan binding domain-containing protein, partial [Chloroflexota bacterium]